MTAHKCLGALCVACTAALAARMDPGDPSSVPALYGRLSPVQGSSGDGGRRAPGMGSRSPASDHVIAMTDRRTVTSGEAVSPWALYHEVANRLGLPYAVAFGSFAHLAGVLHGWADVIAAQSWAGAFLGDLNDAHRALVAAVEGDRPQSVGRCNWPVGPLSADHLTGRGPVCGGRLYPSTPGFVVCDRCGIGLDANPLIDEELRRISEGREEGG